MNIYIYIYLNELIYKYIYIYIFIYLYTCFGDVGCLSESMATLGTSTTHTCAHHCIPGMIVLKYEWKVHTSWSCCLGFLFMYTEETINNCFRTCANTISITTCMRVG